MLLCNINKKAAILLEAWTAANQCQPMCGFLCLSKINSSNAVDYRKQHCYFYITAKQQGPDRKIAALYTTQNLRVVIRRKAYSAKHKFTTRCRCGTATGQAHARPRTGSTSQQPQTGAAESAVRVERIDTWESERQPNTFLLRLGDRAQRKQQRGFRKWQRRK